MWFFALFSVLSLSRLCADDGIVNKANAIMRTEPTVHARVIKLFQKHDSGRILAVASPHDMEFLRFNWFRIDIDGFIGWFYGEDIDVSRDAPYEDGQCGEAAHAFNLFSFDDVKIVSKYFRGELHIGMTEDALLAVLGTPDRREYNSYDGTESWMYARLRGLSLYVDKKSRRLAQALLKTGDFALASGAKPATPLAHIRKYFDLSSPFQFPGRRLYDVDLGSLSQLFAVRVIVTFDEVTGLIREIMLFG
ncbi:MAG: hypothetical protein Ta2A_09430 [Treponemataceae bacterium]|nr:MAG: hypothetical protein Ta2A_09430 [Treponemataceae bacterium]